jgi:hypothetical protein
MELKLEQIRIDGGTQPRVEMNEEVIADYAEQIRSGTLFPPVKVFFDGAAYWLADGFHRYHAHRRIGRDTMVADVQDGGLRDAILHSVGANTEHGLRRTNADKRKAIETMLNNTIVATDEDGNPLSDNDVAHKCHVSQPFVSKLRKEIHTYNGYKYETTQCAFTHPKTGKPAVMKTVNIGKRKNKRAEPPRHGKLKPSVAKLGHSIPNPMIQVNLPPQNPQAAAAGIASLFTKEFIRQLIVELSVYVNQNTQQSGEQV